MATQLETVLECPACEQGRGSQADLDAHARSRHGAPVSALVMGPNRRGVVVCETASER